MIPCIKMSEGHRYAYCGRDVYLDVLKALLQLIPMGKVTTYKDLSVLLKTSSRAVGYLLRLNDQPILIPCHRVIRSNGELGGYTLRGNHNSGFKEKLLRLEGVQIYKGKVSMNSLHSLSKRLIRN